MVLNKRWVVQHTWLSTFKSSVSNTGQSRTRELLRFVKRTVCILTGILRYWQFSWQARCTAPGHDVVETESMPFTRMLCTSKQPTSVFGWENVWRSGRVCEIWASTKILFQIVKSNMVLNKRWVVQLSYGDFFSAKKMSPCYKVHKKLLTSPVIM